MRIFEVSKSNAIQLGTLSRPNSLNVVKMCKAKCPTFATLDRKKTTKFSIAHNVLTWTLLRKQSVVSRNAKTGSGWKRVTKPTFKKYIKEGHLKFHLKRIKKINYLFLFLEMPSRVLRWITKPRPVAIRNKYYF